MYEYDNQSNNSNGSASGTGESAGTGSEYRYSGPFYQDNISSDSSSASSGSSSSSGGYSYSGGSWKDNGGTPKKKKNKKGFGRTMAKTICVALVFGIVAGAAFQGTNYVGRQLFGEDVTASAGEDSTTIVPEISTVTPQTGGTESSGNTVADIVEECMPSLVAITNVSIREVQNYWGFGWYSQPQEQEEISTGTGIIIGQNDSELLIV